MLLRIYQNQVNLNIQFSDHYASDFTPTKNWSIFHSASVCSFADPVPYRVDSYNCPKTVLFVLWRSQVMFQSFHVLITLLYEKGMPKYGDL